MKSLDIQSKVLILNTEKKERFNVYTFVNLETNETQTIVGVKKEVKLHTPLLISISVRLNKEVLKLEDGAKRYLNVASLFINDLEEVSK